MNFDIKDFLPYLLNRAAEKASRGFQEEYKSKYGMLLTEWRVLYHLGRYGEMSAIDICKKGDLHKTKVSRAVNALQKKRYLARKQLADDKRFEILSLTKLGETVYNDLVFKAEDFHKSLTENFNEKETTFLLAALKKITQQNQEITKSRNNIQIFYRVILRLKTKSNCCAIALYENCPCFNADNFPTVFKNSSKITRTAISKISGWLGVKPH